MTPLRAQQTKNQEAGEHVEERRLAGPVGSDHAVQDTGTHFEVHVRSDDKRAEALAEIGDRQHRVGRSGVSSDRGRKAERRGARWQALRGQGPARRAHARRRDPGPYCSQCLPARTRRSTIASLPLRTGQSQGEKNRLLPNSRFATSQILALDHRSMVRVSGAFQSLAGFSLLVLEFSQPGLFLGEKGEAVSRFAASASVASLRR